MNSVILSFFLSIFINIKSFVVSNLPTSFVYKIFNQISNSFDKAYSESCIIKFLSKHEYTDEKYENGYGKISKKIRIFFENVFSFLIKPVSQSRLVLFVQNIAENIFSYPVNLFGYYAISAGIGGIGYGILFKNHLSLCLALIFCAFGLYCIFVKDTLGGLIRNSFFLGKLNVSVKREIISVSGKKIIFYCIALLVLSAVFGPLPLAVLLMAIAGVFVIFKYTKQVLMLSIIALPFLPTMTLAVLTLGIFAVFTFKTILGFEKNVSFSYTSVNLTVFLMSLMFVWGVANSYSKAGSLKSALVYLAFMLVYYLLINMIQTKKDFVLILKGMLWASIICSLLGFYQFINPEGLTVWVDTEMFSDISGRIVSFFENPNVYGEYLIIMIMIILALTVNEKNKTLKGCYIVALLASSACMILTYSRGCWIGIVAAVAIYLFIKHRKVFIIAMLCGIVGLFFLPDTIMTRLLSIGNMADSSTSYRVYIWQGTIRLLKDFWITGIGIGEGAFNMIYPRYSYSAISAPHPHNLYLLLLTEMGILGLLTFIVLILFVLKKLFVVANKSKDLTLRTYASAFTALIVGYLLQGMFDNVWYNYRVFLLFWIIIGLSSVLCILDKKSEDKL